MAAALVGTKIFVVGGIEPGGVSAAVEEYDVSANTWRRVAPLPAALHHTTASSLGGKLYVVGGFTGGWEGVNSVYEYDPAGNAWRTRASMPTARGALAVAVLDGKIYAIAGESRPGNDTSANEEYDP
ncbi:MAG: Kelch repeat-containing protein, partial [bacterium]